MSKKKWAFFYLFISFYMSISFPNNVSKFEYRKKKRSPGNKTKDGFKYFY